ncbi:MAG: redoxin domain-containing protein [Bacteroidia bacterium]|nr:redoxin domain-containing protein [Bacteroidia bacterium]
MENVTSQIYVEPDFVYAVTLPEAELDLQKNKDVELPLNMGVLGTDSTELNALIFDYQEQYNKLFLTENNRFLSRSAMFRRADSLQKICVQRYAHIKNSYFLDYVTYSIATINASVSRGENFLIANYISNHPIRYDHYEYMTFFKACFTGYLTSVASQHKGQTLFNIINAKADYKALFAFLGQDKNIKSDSLRELVILTDLWNLYFSPDFVPDAVENIVSQLSIQTKIKEHKKIALEMMAYFARLQVGSLAPSFSAITKDGTFGTLQSFKGRWIYLNFFSTENIESLKEMPKIEAIKKKLGAKMVFVSICLDDSISKYKKYLKANPKFDWTIWYNYDKSFSKTAKDNYAIVGTEGYFLIDNRGYLAQSPALSPSRGIEFRLNSIFKIKQKTTKTGIR